MIKIPLSKNGTKYKGLYGAIVDSCDADLADLDWNVLKHSCFPQITYAQRPYHEQGKRIAQLMHRVILERILERPLSTKEQVDHIDGDGLNNRRDNLRLATYSQNQGNSRMRKNTTSGYKGVSRNGENWQARIKHNNKRIHIGTFDTPEQAHAAYCDAAKRLFGEFWNDGDQS